MKIKIGYSYYESALSLDPANITSLFQSNLIENFYSRILEIDTDGELVCVLCNKFWTEDNIVNIEFRDDVFTIDGQQITAKDAEASLKRLISKNTNTHGSLKNFIDVSDDQSIISDKNLLKIKLLKPHYSQFFLPLLASMDFSIVSIKTIEEEKNTKQLSLRNTSGPYYLKQDSPTGNLILEANPRHPLYSKSMPQSIEIVPIEFGTGVDSFLENKIDVLDVTYYPRLPEYEKLFEQKTKKFTYHKTLSINLFLLALSKQANDEFTSEQLFYAANLISKTFLSFKKYGYGLQEVMEFFQSNGMGHLEQTQLNEFKKMREVKNKVAFTKPIELGVSESIYERITKAFEPYPEIVVKSYKVDPVFLPMKDRPHIVVSTTDSSFNEDISLLSYNFSMEMFGLSKEDGEKWINNFIQIADKNERIEKMKTLQKSILEKPYIYPIGASPYWAVANADLELNFSEYFPGSSWWKIRKK